MKKLIAAFSLICLSSAAAAEFPVGKAGVRLSPVMDVEVSIPGVGSADGDGNAFGFYGELGGDMVFGYLDHQMSDLDIEDVDADLDETRFGIGLRGSNNTGTLEARVERYDSELEIDDEEGDDDGLAMHVGGALPLNGSAALYGSFGFISLDDSDGNEFRLGARGNMSETVELYGEYRFLELEEDGANGAETDLDDFRIGLNLLF